MGSLLHPSVLRFVTNTADVNMSNVDEAFVFMYYCCVCLAKDSRSQKLLSFCLFPLLFPVIIFCSEMDSKTL